MNRKWLFIPLAILVVAMLAFVGCGTQGVAGPKGDPGEDGKDGVVDYSIVDDKIADALAGLPAGGEASIAHLWIWADGCPEPGDEIVITGSGFPADAKVMLYFAGENNGKELKWVDGAIKYLETNEVGAINLTFLTLPDYDEFNNSVFKDVTPVDDTPCGDGVYTLTINAYVGASLLTTFPMVIVGD